MTSPTDAERMAELEREAGHLGNHIEEIGRAPVKRIRKLEGVCPDVASVATPAARTPPTNSCRRLNEPGRLGLDHPAGPTPREAPS